MADVRVSFAHLLLSYVRIFIRIIISEGTRMVATYSVMVRCTFGVRFAVQPYFVALMFMHSKYKWLHRGEQVSRRPCTRKEMPAPARSLLHRRESHFYVFALTGWQEKDCTYQMHVFLRLRRQSYYWKDIHTVIKALNKTF